MSPQTMNTHQRWAPRGGGNRRFAGSIGFYPRAARYILYPLYQRWAPGEGGYKGYRMYLAARGQKPADVSQQMSRLQFCWQRRFLPKRYEVHSTPRCPPLNITHAALFAFQYDMNRFDLCAEQKIIAALYPYLHYAVFRDAEKEQRITNARNLMLELKPKTSVAAADTGAKEIFGAFLISLFRLRACLSAQCVRRRLRRGLLHHQNNVYI